MGRLVAAPAAAAAAAPAAACLALLLVLVLGGCQRAVRPGPAAPPSTGEPGPAVEALPWAASWAESWAASPAPLGGPAVEGGPIRIALSEGIEPHRAPVPVNDAERIVFRQLYETLVQADQCGGLHPGLAEAWQPLEGGRRWVFRLREGATFWNGTPVDAGAVRRAWIVQRRAGGASAFPWRWISGISLLDPDPRLVTVELTAPLAGPELFTHAALAVAWEESESGWPIGSGPFRPEPISARELRLVRSGLHPVWSGDAPAWPPADRIPDGTPTLLWFSFVPGADARDLLAQGADLVLLRRSAAVEYAELLRSHQVVPLPWDRIHAIVSDRPGSGEPLTIPGDWRADLAGVTMESPAAPAVDLAFAALPDACEANAATDVACAEEFAARPASESGANGNAPASLAGAVLRFDAEDRDAERLAGRLVALAVAGGAFEHGSDRTAAGEALWSGLFGAARHGLPHLEARPADALAGESRVHGAPACIVRLARLVPDACLERAALGDRGATRQVVPLVASRAHVALRRGLGGIQVGWDGTPLLAAAGWGAP